MKKQNHIYYLAAAISLLTFLVYLRTLQNEFVDWDDGRYVFENHHIQSFDLAFFKWAFLDFYEANWHPLTWISHALDYAVWGLNPVGHHLTNNVLHAVNTLLVMVLVAKLIEIAKPVTVHDLKSTPHHSPFTIYDSRFTLLAAATTGLLFGLHPVHVESVAWAAERKDLLCALFFLLSIMMYVKYAGGQKTEDRSQKAEEERWQGKFFTNRHYLLSLGFFTLALLSKPMAVTLPVVLLIVDWYPLKRIQSVKSFWSSCVEKIPFIALSFASSIVTILAQKGAIQSLQVIPLSSRVLVAFKALIAYLGNMAFPIHLIPFYAYPQDVSLFSMEYISIIVFAVVITAACIVIAKKQELFLSIWIYYVVTLSPVLGIIQVGGQAMADRYAYLPSLGPFLLTGLLAAWFLGSMNTLRKGRLLVKRAGVFFSGLAFLSLSYLTFEQIGIWKNNMELWSSVIEQDPEKAAPIAYKNRGTAFDRRGQVNEALKDYDKAIALGLGDAQIFVNRGLVYLKLGQVALAVSDFKRACELGDMFGCNAPHYLLKPGL
jgi:hypothetical protein